MQMWELKFLWEPLRRTILEKLMKKGVSVFEGVKLGGMSIGGTYRG